jgi:PAS domain S-box-containing protein
MVASPHLLKLRELTDELHAKEQELEWSKKTLNSFFSMSLDLLCITGFDGHFLKVNPAWEKALGWTSEELLSKPFIEFVHPDDKQETITKYRKMIDSGENAIYFRNRYQCKDGSYKTLCWTSSVDYDNNTLYAIARDFTAMTESTENARQ